MRLRSVVCLLKTSPHFTYFSNKSIDSSLEQLLWLAATPIFVTNVEVGTHYMACDAGENDLTLAPRTIIEIVVEFIVLVVCGTLHIVLTKCYYMHSRHHLMLFFLQWSRAGPSGLQQPLRWTAFLQRTRWYWALDAHGALSRDH